jgi:putative colanic acid biosynthesis UDP-glucose lipid carrier transferase
MQQMGFRNSNYTNQFIKWIVVGVDFLLLWVVLHFVVDTIPLSDFWDDDKERVFWMVCTTAMMVAEYYFSTVIHKRLITASDIFRRCTMLAITQTLLSYLVLRALHFRAHLGWQFFYMAVGMTVFLIILRFLERWLLMHFRRLGYNTRYITMVGNDPEMQRLHKLLLDNPSYGYKLRSSFVSPSDFASRLSYPEELRLGDELYLCVPRKERELIERTQFLCLQRKVKFYYVHTADEKLNLHSVSVSDNMDVLTTNKERLY